MCKIQYRQIGEDQKKGKEGNKNGEKKKEILPYKLITIKKNCITKVYLKLY